MAPLLSPNAILALSGELGAGKTTFVQGLAAGLNITETVTSPTFVYLHSYEGKLPLFHFDLYRLTSANDFEALGFSEYFFAGGICAIEWPERIFLPDNPVGDTIVRLTFTYREGGRTLKIDSPLLE